MAELKDAKTTASALGITPGCLAKWRISGEGPAFLKIGRRIMYDIADVQAWLDARRIASTSQELAA